MADVSNDKHEPAVAEANVSNTSQSSLSNGDNEKATPTTQIVDVERAGETQGYILDEAKLREQLGLGANAVLKKSNGKVLIPQPTDNPDDPLNWSTWKKLAILVVLSVNAATADYSAATGASALLPQAQQWHISPNTVNHATAGNTFMLGVGGLATVWLSAWAGRLPVLFWFGCLSAGTAAWAAAAKSFESYMAARILNGFFSVAAAGGGLMWIKDVWFFHEHPRKINIWSTAIILSPFLGPQFMAAILSVSTWRTGMWLCFGLIMLGLLCTVLLGEETFYPRHLPQAQIKPLNPKTRPLRLIGVEQYRNNWTTNTLLGSGTRLIHTAMKLPVLLTCIFYFFDFPWTM